MAILRLALVGAVVVGSCEPGPTGPDDFPGSETSGLVVSEPVGLGFGASSATRSGVPAASASVGLSWVSYAPGSFSEGDTLEVRNAARGAVVTAAIVDGGVDPVAIPASVEDTLEIVVLAGGLPRWVTAALVPPESPPRIVRTRPRRRQGRVPLNATMQVVFTEPIIPPSAGGGSVELVGSGAIPVDLVFSPDGASMEVVPRQLLEPGTTHTLVVRDVRDRSGELLEDPFSVDFSTAPLGLELENAVVFESKRSGRSELWIQELDGGDAVQLTHRTAEGQSIAPSLSPDGRTVAFAVAPLQGDWDIYSIQVDGTGLIDLTRNTAFDGWRPAWSPDGTRIAFFSDRDDPANDEIYVMNADGSDVRRLTNDPADDAMTTWSPDGTRLAFETNRAGSYDIWVMNADGTDPRPLTDHPADDEWPAWSPDGTRIAFDSGRDGNREIYVMDADGSNVVRLTHHPGFDSAPAWSRDGSRIAFSSDRAGSTDLWIMNADGSGLVRLTDHPAADFFPTWSR